MSVSIRQTLEGSLKCPKCNYKSYDDKCIKCGYKFPEIDLLKKQKSLMIHSAINFVVFLLIAPIFSNLDGSDTNFFLGILAIVCLFSIFAMPVYFLKGLSKYKKIKKEIEIENNPNTQAEFDALLEKVSSETNTARKFPIITSTKFLSPYLEKVMSNSTDLDLFLIENEESCLGFNSRKATISIFSGKLQPDIYNSEDIEWIAYGSYLTETGKTSILSNATYNTDYFTTDIITESIMSNGFFVCFFIKQELWMGYITFKTLLNLDEKVKSAEKIKEKIVSLKNKSMEDKKIKDDGNFFINDIFSIFIDKIINNGIASDFVYKMENLTMSDILKLIDQAHYPNMNL